MYLKKINFRCLKVFLSLFIKSFIIFMLIVILILVKISENNKGIIWYIVVYIMESLKLYVDRKLEIKPISKGFIKTLDMFESWVIIKKLFMKMFAEDFVLFKILFVPEDKSFSILIDSLMFCLMESFWTL